ncbi:MAG: hypothetical protein JW924_08520 [Fusobacteriaceae bacterium]|nr:hypothetical protein [Fusobacteriaceae bacterium]
MNKFEELIKEYRELVQYFLKNNNCFRLEDSNIGILKEHIIKLLSKYAFLDVKEKLKLYKTLNLIITDENRYTSKRVIIRNNEKKRERIFIINMKTYNIINSIFSK